MNRKDLPNFTQIPNHILDEILPNITGAEGLVLVFLCRKTYGWHKKEDKISISQFEKGTALKGNSIRRALKNLENRKIINRIEYIGRPSKFELTINFGETLPKLEGGSKNEPVPNVNNPPSKMNEEPLPIWKPQNKVNKLTKYKEENSETPVSKKWVPDTPLAIAWANYETKKVYNE